MKELWDAYTAEGKKLEGVTLVRGNSIPKGQYHLICSIIVKHKDGTYLLMQRAPEKTFAGKWELSAGGAVKQNESALEGAVRELREETGISCANLKLIDCIAKEEFRGIFYHFLCETDIEKTAVTFQKGETCAYRWVSKEEVKDIPCEQFMSLAERNIVVENEF